MTLFPGQIDGYSSIPIVVDSVSEIRAADHNGLRSAIIAIEQELGVEPSSVFATVRARLDSISDASALIESHLVDTIDAHDASAISIVDSAENFTASQVEGALSELASILPSALDVIGEDDTTIPNTGIVDFVDGYAVSGTLHVYNTSGTGTDVAKTQPIDITGFHIIEVGENNGLGLAELRMSNHSPATIEWKAPGDSFGASVNISALVEGDIATIESSTTTKRIRIARNSSSFPSVSPTTETFDLLRLNAATGAYSYTSSGITSSTKITRSAQSATGTSRNQFVIGGIVFPADTGTLVLQRKLRLASSEFVPIATLDLTTNFTESLRSTNQLPYLPTLSGLDSIMLFDRYPARADYEVLASNADGDSIYTNYDLTSTFITYQLAQYRIPISNSSVANATLEASTDITASEVESKVSSYRVVHYKAGVTDFIGEPALADVHSVIDTVGDVNDGDSAVRMSNIYLDSSTTRPTIDQLLVVPELDAESVTKTLSGVNYYNGSGDLFDMELRSDTNMFENAYVETDILQFSTDVFTFPGTVDGYGTTVDLENIMDDGYVAYSDSNLPTFSDRGFYISNLTLNADSRPYPDTNKFSTKALITAALHDPFGPGESVDAYGTLSHGAELRVLVNSYGTTRATNTQEWFTDESNRVGTTEVFDFDLDVGQFTGAGSGGTLDSWTSASALSAGELQCGGVFLSADVNYPGLIYPQNDYSDGDIRPTQTASADYSADSGARTHQRLFSLGKSTTGGMLRVKSSGSDLISFDNLAATNSTRPLKIEVKIPGSGGNATGFMDLGAVFKTNATADGDGALVGPVIGATGDFTVPFTFGGNDTGATGNMIAVRITFAPTDGGTNVTDAKLKILSMIELLES